MTRSILFSMLFAAALTGLYRCATEKKEFSVTPPLQNVDVAFTGFDVDAETGGTVVNEHGSTIVVPSNAFVDEQGAIYKGKVTLLYREFHNSADILASGIPMRYDSAGEKIDFQTAGMFEINASAGEGKQKLSIAPGKKLKVNMASFVEGGGYNFYSLSKEGSGWNYAGNSKPVKNEQKQKILSSLPETVQMPVKPKEQDGKQKVFDLSFDETEHPELKGFSGVVWQYSGQPGNASSDPSLNPWVFTYNWQKAVLGSFDPTSMSYGLTLSGSQKTFNTTVSPVLKGKKLKDAMKEFEKKFSKYNQVMEERSQGEKLAEQQGDFMRSFEVGNFGIYNWDCAMHQPNRMIVDATIKFDSEMNFPKEQLVTYLVTASNRSLVQYSSYDLKNFSFDPSQENKIVVILPGNKIATFDAGEFKKLDVGKLKEDKAFTFTLHVQKSGVKSMDQLYTALNEPSI